MLASRRLRVSPLVAMKTFMQQLDVSGGFASTFSGGFASTFPVPSSCTEQRTVAEASPKSQENTWRRERSECEEFGK